MAQIIIPEGSAPSTPSAATTAFYVKSDGHMYSKDDGGVESGPFGGFQMTYTASTSGTSIDFTGIPAGVKKVIIMFVGVSTSGTSNLLFQIGDSGGIETTGYLGTGSVTTGVSTTATNFTTGFGVNTTSAANVIHGAVTLFLADLSSNTWVASGVFGLSSSAAQACTAGSKSLSPGPLDRVRITTVGGSDTFDAGNINVIYE